MAEVGTFMPFVINKSIYALDTRTGQIWANKIKMGGEHGAHFVEDNSWSKYSYPSIEQELEEEAEELKERMFILESEIQDLAQRQQLVLTSRYQVPLIMIFHFCSIRMRIKSHRIVVALLEHHLNKTDFKNLAIW